MRFTPLGKVGRGTRLLLLATCGWDIRALMLERAGPCFYLLITLLERDRPGRMRMGHPRSNAGVCAEPCFYLLIKLLERDLPGRMG